MKGSRLHICEIATTGYQGIIFIVGTKRSKASPYGWMLY